MRWVVLLVGIAAFVVVVLVMLAVKAIKVMT